MLACPVFAAVATRIQLFAFILKSARPLVKGPTRVGPLRRVPSSAPRPDHPLPTLGQITPISSTAALPTPAKHVSACRPIRGHTFQPACPLTTDPNRPPSHLSTAPRPSSAHTRPNHPHLQHSCPLPTPAKHVFAAPRPDHPLPTLGQITPIQGWAEAICGRRGNFEIAISRPEPPIFLRHSIIRGICWNRFSRTC